MNNNIIHKLTLILKTPPAAVDCLVIRTIVALVLLTPPLAHVQESEHEQDQRRGRTDGDAYNRTDRQTPPAPALAAIVVPSATAIARCEYLRHTGEILVSIELVLQHTDVFVPQRVGAQR